MMVKKRRTKAQKVHASNRQVSKPKSNSYISAIKIATKIATPTKQSQQRDLAYSLTIVGILIGVQLLVWLLFRLTPIDDIIYSRIAL